MSNDYRTNPRESTIALLDRLDGPSPKRFSSRLMVWAAKPLALREGGPVAHARASVAVMAKNQGLAHIGAVSEAGHPRELWVDLETHAHQLHSGRRALTHFVVTYFDDGSAVLTYAHRNPVTPSNESLLVRPGSGRGVERDWDDHREAALAWAEKRRVEPLVVENVATAARMVRHYYAALADSSLAPLMLLARVLPI
jgi:hypothetical protein